MFTPIILSSCARTSTIHQVRRNSLHFLSTDRDLELASSNSNFNQARQQRLSSIISSEEYEEQEEDITPNAIGKY